MSPEQPEFTQLANNVKEIRDAMLGDPIKGNIGFMQNQHRMMEDVYGILPDGSFTEMTKKNCMLTRMSRQEDNQKKVLWIGTGVMGCFTIINVGISKFIASFFSNK